jgi:hypothetical protein
VGSDYRGSTVLLILVLIISAFPTVSSFDFSKIHDEGHKPGLPSIPSQRPQSYHNLTKQKKKNANINVPGSRPNERKYNG